MAFTQSTFAPVGAHSSDTPNLFSYKTQDRLFAVTQPNYFNDKRFQLREGDFMLIQAFDGSEFAEVDSTRSGVFAVTQPSLKTAFGEEKVESNSPVTQISAQNGLLQNVLATTDDLASGTNSVVNKKFTCQTGTDANGLATILSLRQISSRAGQGLLADFSVVFGAGVVDSTQVAGLITSENNFSFALVGTSFGILSIRDGLDELQELTLTVAASGAETATVTIDGTPFNVSLTGAGSLSDDAFEISEDLNANVVNYNFSSNGATVIAQSALSGPQGTFDYSSTGVSEGTFSQIEEGTSGIPAFIPQASWNFDTRLEGDVNTVLDPFSYNNYQIQLNSAVDFFIEDRETKKQVLVHRIPFVNSGTDNNPANSTFRVGWAANNSGNTSNVTIQGDRASIFNEGVIYYDNTPRSDSNSQTIPAGSSIQTSVLILRNRISFSNALNRAEVLPYVVSASTESNKFASFRLILNPSFSSPVNFSYIDKVNSLVEVSKDAVVVTGGREIGSVIVEAGNPQTMSFNENTITTTTSIFPGDVIAIVATLQAGGGADCQASITFREDL